MRIGKLYVIGTPIGNLEDITYRAVETLSTIETLVCEDTRVAARLVNHYLKLGVIKNKPRYFAYNEYNESKIYPEVIRMLEAGEQVGLVSDAGMPALSDPGYRVIRAALDSEIEVEIIPGPSALTTALAWSGLGGESMLYLGFLPKTKGKAERALESAWAQMKSMKSLRVVLYVSPHRVLKELLMIRELMGEVRVVLLREMTKKFQERIESTPSELIDKYEKSKPKGEIVMVLSDK